MQLCNLSDKPITGRARVWRLDPGQYYVYFGQGPVNPSRRPLKKLLRRGDEIELTLEPKEESREFIREWVPGRRIEDYVLSAVIQARK